MQESRADRRQSFNRTNARELRNNSTGPERYLWKLLSRLRSEGIKFRRQQPVGKYIVDFFCPASKLIVELDGSQHHVAENAAYDQERTQWLEERGYCVLRFHNADVIKQRDVVFDSILAVAKARTDKQPE
jgi:very-short-patch-repair endonuclease